MSTRLSRAVLCAFLLAAALAPSAAKGANHPFLFGVSELPSAHPPLQEFIEDPCGLTVDSAGKFYVSDYYHESIDIFAPTGSFAGKILDKVDPLDGACALAFDPAGDLFVNDYHRYAMELGAPELSAVSVIDSANSTGVAVEQSTGNLFVDNRTYIAAYEAPVFPGEEPIKIGLGTLEDGYGIAVSDFPATQGLLYVPDAAGETVKVYDPAQSLTDPIEEIDGAGSPQGGFVSLTDAAVAIDRSDGHLFVLDQLQQYAEHPLGAVDEFNSAGAYRGGVPQLPLIVDGEPSGLAVDNSAAETQGRLYVGSGNGEKSSVYAYGPTGPAHGLKASITGAGNGAVKSQPAGIACPPACGAEFNQGAEVTLSATPQAGSAFLAWSVDGNPATCPGTGTCRVILGADLQVDAEFEALPQAASAPSAGSAEPAGSVSALGAFIPAPAAGAPSAKATGPTHHHRHHHRHKRRRGKR